MSTPRSVRLAIIGSGPAGYTAAVYAALDIMTFPNQGIGLGRPVLEAAMHGKPVVASGSRSGANVLVPGETGLLLEDATPEHLARALRLLIDDPALRARDALSNRFIDECNRFDAAAIEKMAKAAR